MKKDAVISFEDDFTHLNRQADKTERRIKKVSNQMDETTRGCAELYEDLQDITGVLPLIRDSARTEKNGELNELLEDVLPLDFKKGTNLTVPDTVIAILTGVIASVIDLVFVGTPEIVKIYRNDKCFEHFDGSIFTKQLRKAGNGDDHLSKILKWLSQKCKVPYDISAASGIVTPNNHRLRCFAHDPLIGALFAIVDIIMGTATLIDNKGQFRVLVNPKEYPASEKLLALLYYIGHILSDVCTARGIPIPGFVLTQFFTNGEDPSLARIVEQMYVKGYDLRHLASMYSTVFIKKLIIQIYIDFFKKETVEMISTIAQKEISEQQKEALNYKMFLISDIVCCNANLVKFFAPPTMGNITAINLSEWTSLIKNTIINIKYVNRDTKTEEVLYNRDVINKNWDLLF